MRSVLAILICFFSALPAWAQGDFSACVSSREMSGIVAANKFIAPAAAVVTVRRNIANADVVRADLCKRGNEFIYVIVALQKDGRAVQVLVHPESGKIVKTQ